MAQALRLRPSDVLKFDDCPAQYYFGKVEKLRKQSTSANLPFGSAIHEAMTGYILSTISGKPFDPVAAFEADWDKGLESEIVEFSSQWDEASMRATGIAIAERFPDAWDQTGYVPLMDEHGPVVERRFEMPITDSVVLSGQPDVVAMDADCNVIALDLKTTAAQYDPIFALASEQLTAYQMLLEHSADDLGISGIDKVGFMEVIKKKIPKTKRGTGPEVKEPLLVDARSSDAMNEYRDKLLSTAIDIKKGYFPRRPRMAYNSPCTMCDFRNYCLQGSKEGLVQPETEATA